MKKMKLSREMKVGIFGVSMIALLYWGVNFLRGSELFSSRTQYYAVYNQINGLESAANVMIKGFKVGSVTDIKFDPGVNPQIILELSINSEYKIPRKSSARGS